MRALVLVIAGLALLAPAHATPAFAQHGGWPSSYQDEEYDADNDHDVDQDADVDPDPDGKPLHHEELDPADDRYDHSDEAPPPDMRGYPGETWQGEDGLHYCRRSDGTTGTIIGGGAGALIGRGIDTRGNRGTGTILGAVFGALIGRAIDRAPRCR